MNNKQKHFYNSCWFWFIINLSAIVLIVIIFIATAPNTNQVATKSLDIVCSRKTPYDNPAEFQRAISLIEQRTSQYAVKNYSFNPNEINKQIDDYVKKQNDDKVATVLRDHNLLLNSGLRKIKNCLDIKYASSDAEMDNAEGFFFMPAESDPNHLSIKLSPRYAEMDDLTISFLLAHEIDHAIYYSPSKLNGKTKESCFLDESGAYITQFSFMAVLNNQELTSITNKFDRQPGLKETSSIKSLVDLYLQLVEKDSPDMLMLDFSMKVSSQISKDPFYQKQCSVYPEMTKEEKDKMHEEVEKKYGTP